MDCERCPYCVMAVRGWELYPIDCKVNGDCSIPEKELEKEMEEYYESVR